MQEAPPPLQQLPAAILNARGMSGGGCPPVAEVSSHRGRAAVSGCDGRGFFVPSSSVSVVKMKWNALMVGCEGSSELFKPGCLRRAARLAQALLTPLAFSAVCSLQNRRQGKEYGKIPAFWTSPCKSPSRLFYRYRLNSLLRMKTRKKLC